MVDDTLLPVAYENRIVKTRLGAQHRYALAREFERVNASRSLLSAQFLRHVIVLGLEQMGWTEERIIKEYAEYRVECLRSGKTNPYESE